MQTLPDVGASGPLGGVQAKVGGACGLQSLGPAHTPLGVAYVVAPALEPGNQERSQPHPGASECSRETFLACILEDLLALYSQNTENPYSWVTTMHI